MKYRKFPIDEDEERKTSSFLIAAYYLCVHKTLLKNI